MSRHHNRIVTFLSLFRPNFDTRLFLGSRSMRCVGTCKRESERFNVAAFVVQSVQVMVMIIALVGGQAAAEESTSGATAEIGADGVQRLSITLDSYSFSPADIVVRAG